MRINQINRIRNRKNRRIQENKIKYKPQMKGLTVKIFTMSPRKPNSALRKVA